LALVGLFPFAGFWSKDEILAEAFMHREDPLHLMVYVAGVVAAAFTALYMGRQMGLVFSGKPRTALAEHAHEPGWRMTGPLIILAFFALLIGFINLPVDLGGNAWLHGFAGEVHEIAGEAAPGISFDVVPFNYVVAGSSFLIGLFFFALGWWRYSRVRSADAKDPVQLIPGIGEFVFTVLYNKYYFDEIYRGLFIYPVVWLANFSGRFDYEWVINPIVNFVGRFTSLVADGTAVFDKYGIDGYFVNGIPGSLKWFGGQLRLLQTGRAQNYVLILIMGVLILVSLYLAIFSGQSPNLAVVP
jgi:NADH-quinone oxidoreductase subunit L